MSKRILSVILLICMLVNNLPVAAFAEGTDSGCSHVCDSSCGYVAAVACDKGCTPAEEGGEIVHADGCAFNAGSPCSHKHNGDCGVECVHTGGTATCTALAVCDTCGKGYGDLADHTYSQGTCSVCGEVCEHSYNTEGICSVCGMAEPQPVCDCEVKCAETGNAACDFCGIDGADLTQCIGKEPKVECDCESKCTAENKNSDCPVCKAEDADLINCIGKEPETEAPVVTVSEWEWVENEDGVSIDREEDGTYVTDLPKVGSLEMVKSVLPAYIQVGETQVEITWQCDGFSEAAGTYIFTAVLPPEGYELAEDAPALTLKVNMGVAEELEGHKHCAHGKQDTCELSTWGGWDGNEGITYTNGVAYVYLTSDVVLTSKLEIGEDKTLYLCLNGKTLTCSYVAVYGNLILCDCSTGSTGEIITTGDYGVRLQGKFTMNSGIITANSGTGVKYVSDGALWNPVCYAEFTMNGGTINAKNKIGVDVYSGKTFTMNGGKITGHGSTEGGGVCVRKAASFTMNGGEISGCSATNGGGIYVFQGTVTITSGEISDNEATEGGGIYTNGNDQNRVYLTLNNAAIKNNTATGNGGGIYTSGAKVTMNTGCEITGNVSGGNGGGAYSGSQVILNGGVISGNTAATNGGGVYAKVTNAYDGDYTSVISSVTIQNNVGGGLYLYAQSSQTYVNMNGSPVINGNVAAGAPRNLYLEGAWLNITSLDPNTRIGLSGEAHYNNGNTLSTDNHSAYVNNFKSEKPGQKIGVNDKGAFKFIEETNVPTDIKLDLTNLPTDAEDKPYLPLEEGGTATLSATVTGNEGCQDFVTWSSDTPEVATVVATADGSGRVTAVGPGTATITAKTVNNHEATCKVTVTAASYPVTRLDDVTLTVDGNNVAAGGKIEPGKTVTMTVSYEEETTGDIKKYIPTVTDSSDETVPLDLIAEDTTNQTHTYTFTMPASNIEITATDAWASSVTYQVLPNAAAGTVTILPTIAAENETVTVECTPADGYEFVSCSEEEQSLQPSSLTEEEDSSSDTVTYRFEMGEWNTLVTVTFQKKITDVTLYAGNSEEALAEGANLELAPQGNVILRAALSPEGVGYRDITWTSSERDVATVAAVADESSSEDDTTSGSGVIGYMVNVVANQPGTATITATAGGKSATCTINVVEKYNVWVGGVQVTSANKDNIVPDATGTAKYDPDSNTLTLDNFSYTGEGYAIPDTDSSAVIYSNGNLKLKLVGVNSITYDNSAGLVVAPMGLYVDGDLTVTDDSDGSLTATAGYLGIYSKGNITIPGGNISVKAIGTDGDSMGIFSNGNLTINGGTVEATGSNCGIAVQDGLTLNGGIVTVKGSESGIMSQDDIIINSGTLEATASGDYGIGIVANTVTVNGGTVVAISTGEYGYGTTTYDGVSCNGDFDVYAGDAAPGKLVTSPTQTTYNSKYVKIFPGYIITFESNGGSAVEPMAVEQAKPEVTQLPKPTKENHTFGGWYTNAELTGTAVTSVTLTGDMTLYAKWTINQHTIAFDVDGGDAIASITGDYGTTVTAPANPTKTGYTFEGWYTNADRNGTAVTSVTLTGDMTLYAKWTINRYTITFDTDGGSTIEAITQDYGTAVTAPTNPTKAGYTFAGWEPTIPEKMPLNGSTVKAKWTLNPATVTTGENYSGDYDGKTHTIAVSVGDHPAGNITYTYQWYKDGKEEANKITGATDASYNVKNVADSGTYYCKVTAAVNGDQTSVDSDPVVVTIKPKALTVTANDKAITYGDEPANDGVTYNGFVDGENESVLSGTLGYAYSYTQYGDVGEYTITPKDLTSDNYNITFNPGKLIVGQKKITVTAEDQAITYGDEFQQKAIAADLAGNDKLDSVTVTADKTVCPGGVLTASEAIIKNGEKNVTANYDITYKTGELTVNKATPTISWETKTFTYDGKSHGEATVTLVNGETYTGKITYTCGGVEGLPTNAGNYGIRASIEAHGNYNAATATANIQIQRKAVTPTVTLTPETFTYNNEDKEPAVLVKDGTTVLSSEEYSVAYASNVEVGAGNVCITDKTGGNYAVATANVKFLILPDTSALEDVTTENVTSANTAAIDAIQAAMANKDITGASAEAKAAWDALAARCTDLEKAIADAATGSEDITEDAAALPEDIKTSDLNKINEILNQYADIEDNLTAEQKTALAEVIRELEKQKAAIEKTNADLKSVDDGTQDLVEDKPNLEYADKATIKALEDKIADMEKNNSYLSESDKQNLQTQKTTLATLKAEFVEADKVTDQVNALNTKAEPDDGNAVAAYEDAKKAYAELSDADKAKVDPAALEHLADMKAALTAYKIIKGDGTKHLLGSSQGLTIVSNGYYPHFRYVKVNGREISSSNYTSASGSTIVTLKPEYVNRLMTGKYTITIGFGDEDYIGEATANVQLYTDSGLPFTGDTIAMWIAMMAVSAGALVCVVVYAKKKSGKK